MVLTLPPADIKYNSDGVAVPDLRYTQNEIQDITLESVPKSINFQLLNIIDLPFVIILKNIANTMIVIIIDLFNLNNYQTFDTFTSIFMKENRLLYLGIITIVTSLFVSFFFE